MTPAPFTDEALREVLSRAIRPYLERCAQDLIAGGKGALPFDALLDDALAALAPRVAAMLREGQAEAWEQGHGEGMRDADLPQHVRDGYPRANPYKETT